MQSVVRELLRAEQGKNREDCETGDLRARIFVMAEHKIIDRARYWRRDKRDARLEPMPANDGDLAMSYSRVLSPSRQAMSAEAIVRIEQAFDQLPARYREILLLSRFAGLDYDALGEKMGCNAHSARTLVSRATVRLATLLGPDFPELVGNR